MVLADGEDVEAHLVGQLDLFDQVAQSLLGVELASRLRVEGDLAERVHADLHRGHCIVSLTPPPSS